jgi:hypothetical protein
MYKTKRVYRLSTNRVQLVKEIENKKMKNNGKHYLDTILRPLHGKFSKEIIFSYIMWLVKTIMCILH